MGRVEMTTYVGISACTTSVAHTPDSSADVSLARNERSYEAFCLLAARRPSEEPEECEEAEEAVEARVSIEAEQAEESQEAEESQSSHSLLRSQKL